MLDALGTAALFALPAHPFVVLASLPFLDTLSVPLVGAAECSLPPPLAPSTYSEAASVLVVCAYVATRARTHGWAPLVYVCAVARLAALTLTWALRSPAPLVVVPPLYYYIFVLFAAFDFFRQPLPASARADAVLILYIVAVFVLEIRKHYYAADVALDACGSALRSCTQRALRAALVGVTLARSARFVPRRRRE